MSAARFAGVFAATTTAMRADGSVDLDRYREHCQWLVSHGVAGIVPNGSVGEYETLSDAEREAVAAAAVEAVGRRVAVVPGVSGRTAVEASRWAEQARELGAPAVLALPPTSHRATGDEIVAHYAEIAKAGLPVIAANNPCATRVDLTPRLLARIADEVSQVVAVTEFARDPRRVWQIAEHAPRLEVLCGCDDALVESMLAGAVGWIACFANALPAQSVRLYRLCAAGDFTAAAASYRVMLPLLRWDAGPRFVQAVKLAQGELGRAGGPVRLPRLPLPGPEAEQVRAAARAAAGRPG